MCYSFSFKTSKIKLLGNHNQRKNSFWRWTHSCINHSRVILLLTSFHSLRSQSLTSTLMLGFLGNISVKTEEVNWKILKLFMNMLTICLFGKRNNYESRVRQHKVIWLSLQVQWVVSNGIIDILAVNHRACLNSFFPILCVAYSYLGRTNWCSRHFQNRILSLTISTWFLRFCIYCYFSRILNRWVVVIEWENCETLYGQFSYNVWQVTKLSGSCDCI